MGTVGVEGDGTPVFHGTSATAARSGFMRISPNVDGAYKVLEAVNPVGIAVRVFVASTSPLDAVRIFPLSGGNLTGGTIKVLTR